MTQMTEGRFNTFTRTHVMRTRVNGGTGPSVICVIAAAAPRRRALPGPRLRRFGPSRRAVEGEVATAFLGNARLLVHLMIINRIRSLIDCLASTLVGPSPPTPISHAAAAVRGFASEAV